MQLATERAETDKANLDRPTFLDAARGSQLWESVCSAKLSSSMAGAFPLSVVVDGDVADMFGDCDANAGIQRDRNPIDDANGRRRRCFRDVGAEACGAIHGTDADMRHHDVDAEAFDAIDDDVGADMLRGADSPRQHSG
eukprot:3931918-Rhodomonas_salina.2